MKLDTKYQRPGPGFRQEDFSSFHLKNLLLAPVTYMCNGLEPFEKNLKEDQPMIIPVKFGQNPINGLGDVI